MVKQRLAKLAWERGFALGLLVTLAYLVLAPHHVVAGDNAEFATLGAVGGRAHPSGYPLYVLWLRAWAWLPAASAAHRASLVTALLAGAQVVVLHAACRAWGARAGAATIAVAVFAGASLVVRVHTEADVFALNSLIVSAVLWLAGEHAPVRGVMRVGLLGLVAGLGIANNLTCVLLAPVGLQGALRGAREATRWPRAVLAGLGGLAVGVLPYVYLVIAPERASWGEVHSFDDLLYILLRRDYGTFTHVPGAAAVSAGASLSAHLQLVARIWLWAGLLVGIGVLAERCVRSRDRLGWSMLALAWLVSGPLFAWRLQIESHGVGAYIASRMQIMSAIVLAIPIAIGLGMLAERIRKPLSPALPTLGASVLFGALVLVAWPKLSRVHGGAVEAGVRNTLRSLPENAVAIVVSEDQCFGAHYLQLAEHERTDVTVVCWTLASRAWYRDRLEQEGLKILAPSGPASVGQAYVIFTAGRPLFVDDSQTTLLAALPSYPYGVLTRVLPKSAQPPSLGEIMDLNRSLFAHFDFDYPRPQRDDDFAAVAHLRYAQTWKRIAGVLDGLGDHANAAAALELAREVGPE